MARAVQKVALRCEHARLSPGVLDLSDCKLMQVPDAIYFMLKDTTLTACNLSFNIITKIPAKFPTNFSNITDLNVSNNRLSTLPEEMSQCHQLETVDISNNSFISLPVCLFSLPSLLRLDGNKNFITDVDVELLVGCVSLEDLNVEANPLTRDCVDKLRATTTGIRIRLTERRLEEWEDLSI